MKLALPLALLTSINILITFAHQWYLVWILGPGVETDAFFAGMIIPQLVFSILSGSLTYVLVPILSIEMENSSRLTWNFLQLIGFISCLMAFALFLTADHWVPWTIPGFEIQARQLTISLARIQLPALTFSALAAVLTAAYHARQRFVRASVCQVGASVAGIAVLLLAVGPYGVKAAAWAHVIKSCGLTILLLPGIGRYHFFNFGDQAIRDAWEKVRPLLFGSIYFKSEYLVDRLIASFSSAGDLSLFHFSQQIYGAGNQVACSVVASPLVPILARKSHSGDWLGFKRVLESRLIWMTFLFSILYTAVMFGGQTFLSLLFAHGKFSHAEIYRLWLLMMALGGLLFGSGLGQILSTSYYAQGETVIPTKIGILGFTFGILLKLGGFFFFGFLGFAVGTSAYYLLNTVLLYLPLRRTIGANVRSTVRV
jgi:putative peptidoglycan lipid II flippase